MGGCGSVKELGTKAELDALVQSGTTIVVYFRASSSEASNQLDEILSALSADFPHTHFLRVEAEEQPEIFKAFSTSALLPYFAFFKDGEIVDKLERADPFSLAKKVAEVAGKVTSTTVLEIVTERIADYDTGGEEDITESSDLSTALTSRIESLINSSPLMLFMKGTPDKTECGFSRKVVEILREENVAFESFDILFDDEVCQGLKVYSKWSSYPQLYINGELIGGLDIVLEMQKSGELKKFLAQKGLIQKQTLEDRLRELINSSPVMLFMKGIPDSPRCEFNSKVVDALRGEGIEFGYFDILADEEVRQGLKVFSNWPTYPQLYYKGQLIGGCDIVMELCKNGELKSTLSL